MSGLVSTIIPVFNRSRMLQEAVDSVLAQTYRPIEIIVVDDGSTDETGDVAGGLSKQHSEIEVLHVSNGGAGLAREAGRQIARGEYIQYLDSDDLLLPSKFELQVAALQTHLECDVAYGYMRLVDGNGRVLRAPSQWTGRTYQTLFPALLADRWWGTHTPLYRRSLCDTVGAWSDMRRGEDWEYEARVGALGARLWHCKDYVCDDRQHDELRVTGTIDAPMIRDAARLQRTLYQCARNAGVALEAPEMQHFSRHSFLLARLAGREGLRRVSKDLFGLARESAGRQRAGGKDFRLYRFLAASIGWRMAGRLACCIDRFRKRNNGAATMVHSRAQPEVPPK